MNRIIAALATLAALTLGSAAAAQSCALPGNVNQLATQLAQGVNQSRVVNGTSAISIDPRLMAAAQRQACDVARSGRMEHRGSDGTSSNDRVLQAGFQTCLTAENLAWGYPQPSQIINGWLASPGHRTNMLHARVSSFGVGIAQGSQGPIWVLVLARGC